MKKGFLGIALLVFFFALAGCSTTYTYYQPEPRAEYYPYAVENVKPETAATIKTAEGVSIFKVDNDRVASFFEAMAGKHDSVLVAEGEHSLVCSRRSTGRDMVIGKVFYKANHEYLIDFIEESNGNRTKTYYWVKDLTDNKVVGGKEVTREELEKENQ